MENDFVIVLNDIPIDCNKKIVNSNFPEYFQDIRSTNDQIKIDFEDANDFIELTKDIFQGNDFEITTENLRYLFDLSEKLKSADLKTKLNSYCYLNECDGQQIDQNPLIQFLVELSSLVHQLSLSNYEDLSSQIKQMLIPQNNEATSNKKDDDSEYSEKDEYDEKDDYDDSEEEINEEEKILSLKKIGNKQLNKLFYYEIINTLSSGSISSTNLQNRQDKVAIIIQLIKEIDSEIQKKLNIKEKDLLINSFINYIITKYTKIKNQRSSLKNCLQETKYLIHHLLSSNLITLSQIHQEKEPIDLYFLEFFSKEEIDQFFLDHEQIADFLSNEIKDPKRNENKTKKNNNTKIVKFLSKSLKNCILLNNELIQIFLNDNIEKFKEKFTTEVIDNYKLTKDISNISCFSALNQCSLFELSAFMGSYRIFEYLTEKLTNQEIQEPQNLANYVILGQNPQILRSFLNRINSKEKLQIYQMLSFCIDHHFKDTFNMIIDALNECPKITIKQLDEYMKKCVSRGYFDVINFLLQRGATTNVLLNLFCKAGNEIGVEYMLDFSYIDVNTPYKNKAPLEYCIYDKNANTTFLLLKNDYINIQAIDEKLNNGEKVIHLACKFGLARAVSYLFRRHLYDINLPTQEGICPIHFACESGNYETVVAVIRTKKVRIRARVKEGDFKNRTALHFACLSGNPNIINLILDSDERLGLDDVDESGKTPIIYAIEGDYVDCVNVLLGQEDIDIDQEYNGDNLLQYACLKNKTKVFDAIINSIVFEPNQACSDGRQILVIAIQNRNVHMVKSILEKFGRSVDVNVETKDGKTPLIIACGLGETEMVKLLLDCELIKTNKTATSDGSTPFMAAAKSGNVEILKMLMNDEDVDIYAENNKGMTAIHFAFFSQHIEAVKFLLPLFNDKLNDRIKTGETLFQVACKNNKIELSKLLIDNPAVDVTIRDNTGMSAYLSSVESNNKELLDELIKSNKCDLNEKTLDGRNAFIIAIQNGHLELVKFFIQLYIDKFVNGKQKVKSKSKKKNKEKEENNDNQNNEKSDFVDIKVKTNNDRTPLFIALKSRNANILKELIKCPYIDINETSKDRTFLCKVVQKMCNNNQYNNNFNFNYNNIFNLVLERDDLEVNKPSKKFYYQTCLHIACKSSNIKLVHRIFKIEGIDINAESQEGTPLYLLIKYQSSNFKKKAVTNYSHNYNVHDSYTRQRQERFNTMLNILKEPTNHDYYSEDDDDEESSNENSNQNTPPKSSFVSASPQKTTTIYSSSNNTQRVEDNENYWHDILDIPELDSNKGGNSSFVQRSRYRFANNANNNTTNNDEIIINDSPLICAINKHSQDANDIALALLKRKDIVKGINFQNAEGKSALLASVSNDNKQIYNKLLTFDKIDYKCQDNEGRTCLHLLVQYVIDNYSNYHNRNHYGYYSDRRENPDVHYDRIVDLYKRCPQILNISNKNGQTPLFNCINNVHDKFDVLLKIIKYFLDQKNVDLSLPSDILKVDIENQDETEGEYSNSLLHIACTKKIHEIVDKLLPLSVSFYKKKSKNKHIFIQKNKNKNTILNVACTSGDIDSVISIINYIINPQNRFDYNNPKKFDINCLSSSNIAPLHYICKLEENGKSIQLLDDVLSIDSLDVNLPIESNGKTPLYLACENNNLQMVKHLLNHPKIDVNRQEKNSGLTVLMYSITYDRMNLFDIILNQEGIDINIVDKENKTALHHACSKDNTEFGVKLINFSPDSIDPNAYDKTKMTPLLIAAENGKLTIVQNLLSLESIDVNLPIPTSGKTPLFVACENNNKEVVKFLLDDPRVNINCKDKQQKSTILMLAIKNENDELLNIILSKEEIDINAVDCNGNTALHHICMKNNKNYFDSLVNYEAPSLLDPNIYNKNDKTPLLIAVSGNYHKIVKRLLRLDYCDVNLPLPRSNTSPLYISCLNWNFKIASMLINDSRTDPNVQESNTGKTALMYSIEEFKADLFSIILANEKTNLYINDKKSLTPLHYVCKIGNVEFIKKVLEKIDEVSRISYMNAQDVNGLTPLHYACMSNNKDAIMYFLELNKDPNDIQIDINICDKRGFTPFDIYISNPSGKVDTEVYNEFKRQNEKPKIDTTVNIQEICEKGHYEMIKFMISNLTFDINNNDNKNKMTLLHILCQNQKTDLVRLLLSRKSDTFVNINPVDINNMTPLHYAVKANFNAEVVQLLINTNECDVNAKDNKGRTALHYACEFGNILIIEELLKYTDLLDLNAQDFNGSTILHDIARTPLFDKNILKMLLNSNCNPPINPNIVDNDGNSPLHIACFKENSLFVTSLIDLSPFEIDVNIINKKYQTPLNVVCMKNDFVIFETLFSSKLCDNIDINLTSPIFIAAYKQHFVLVNKLLEMPRIDLNCNKNQPDYSDYESIEYDFYGCNLVHIISSYDSLDLLKYLLQTDNFDINEKTLEYIPNGINGTPLIIALKNNQINNVNFFIENFGSQLDLSIFDSSGLAAIHYCLELNNPTNSIEILKELINIDERIIDMEVDNKSRKTPLMIAFQNNSFDCCNLLLDNPSLNLFCIDINQNSIFHYLAKQKRKDIIDLTLRKLKASPYDWDDAIELINIDNNEGKTALLIGCEYSNYTFVNSLIETFGDSLDFSKSDFNNNSPFIAAIKSRNDELINLLILNENCISNVDLSVPINENKDYILQLIAKNSTLNNFILLIQQASNHLSNPEIDLINVKNYKNESVLSYAVSNNKSDLFDYICRTQITDLNMIDETNCPLLFKVTKNCSLSLFESMLKYGKFDVNMKYDGQYLLHCACESHYNSSDKVRLLVQQDGIDPNCVTDKDLLTPLHIAVKSRKTDIIQTLLNLDDKIDVNKKNKRNKSPKEMARTRPIVRLFNYYDQRNRKADVDGEN